VKDGQEAYGGWWKLRRRHTPKYKEREEGSKVQWK